MDYGKGKEPKGALAIMVASKGPLSAPKTEELGDAGSSAFASFAKAAGIPQERQAAAKAALKAYVKACLESPEGDDKEY